jgi:diguanylate cyclase (GGDEF)-like protein
MFGLASIALLLLFGGNAIVHDMYHLGAVLFGAAIVGVFSILLMRRTRDDAHGRNGISIGAVIIFSYLIVSGGVDNTGPLWCYPTALVITLLQGFRKGVIALIGLLIFSAVVMFVPDIPLVTAEYAPMFKARFMASFIALGIMASIYEHLRGKSQHNYIAISRELERASRTDVLTALANRRAMITSLEAAYGLYQRHGQLFSVIMIDLDFFKQVNDRYGHGVGDDLLKLLAKMLVDEVRQQDLVSRWGGEEFLVLLPHASLEQSLAVAEKLRREIAATNTQAIGMQEPVTASLGVQCIGSTRDLSTLIIEVDRNLYEAKRRGRNQVCWISRDRSAAGAP